MSAATWENGCAVWHLDLEVFVSLPSTGRQAWADRDALVARGVRAAELDVREYHSGVPRCEDGHPLEDDDAACEACAAHSVAQEWESAAEQAEEELESLRAQLREATEEIAGLTTDCRELRAQLRSLTAFPGDEE